MRSIEINTAQNVTIEYELASLQNRLLAFLLDAVILFVGGLILYFLGTLVLVSILGLSRESIQYYSYLVLFPALIFYTPLSETFMNGQTVGKLALGIRAVKLNGKQCTVGDYMIRWMFSIIDIYFCFGSVAAILVSSTDKNQRIGDIVANTVVIKIRPTRFLSLPELLNIHSVESYVPRYPEVKYFSEEDMLLVKLVLERNRRYANDAHRRAMDELVARLMNGLGINKIQQEKADFLRTILNDYIVLTR